MEFSSFTSHKKEKDKSSLELELKILKESLNQDYTVGDLKILERKIYKLENEIYKLELELETTVAGDIAMTQNNLFANCTGKDDCECGRCQLLRKKELKESKEFSPFGRIFGA